MVYILNREDRVPIRIQSKKNHYEKHFLTSVLPAAHFYHKKILPAANFYFHDKILSMGHMISVSGRFTNSLVLKMGSNSNS